MPMPIPAYLSAVRAAMEPGATVSVNDLPNAAPMPGATVPVSALPNAAPAQAAPYGPPPPPGQAAPVAKESPSQVPNPVPSEEVVNTYAGRPMLKAMTVGREGEVDTRPPSVIKAQQEFDRYASAANALSEGEALDLADQDRKLARRHTAMMQAKNDELEDRVNADRARAQEQYDKLVTAADALTKANKIDPDRYWNSRSTGQKLAWFAASIFGGARAGLQGGENQTLKAVDYAIDRDIAAQRANFEQAKDIAQAQSTAYGQARLMLGDDIAASNAVRLSAQEVFKSQMEEQGALWKAHGAKEKAADFDLKLKEMQRKRIEDSMRMQHASRVYVDPITGVAYTADQARKYYDEALKNKEGVEAKRDELSAKAAGDILVNANKPDKDGKSEAAGIEQRQKEVDEQGAEWLNKLLGPKADGDVPGRWSELVPVAARIPGTDAEKYKSTREAVSTEMYTAVLSSLKKLNKSLPAEDQRAWANRTHVNEGESAQVTAARIKLAQDEIARNNRILAQQYSGKGRRGSKEESIDFEESK